MIDYKKQLFQIEQWSPYLARKIWGLTSMLEVPLPVALSLNVTRLSDSEVEVVVPHINLQNASILAAGEFASKILWQRHLRSDLEAMTLESVHCRFIKPIVSQIKVRTKLDEIERERILRRLKAGDEINHEMSVVFWDEKDQQVAGLNCVWHFKPLRPIALT